ncbi:MAG: hypothetical protein H7A13_03570 [Pseudomonadales bacterium]|nr:hypothetical protein [Pseudomonadales bacterium]
MIELRGALPPTSSSPKGMVAQHLPVGAQRLFEDFLPMGDEKQPRTTRPRAQLRR